MAEDIALIFQTANCMFSKQNYQQAEELYTNFINSCLQARNCDVNKLATAYNNRGQIKYLRVDFDKAAEDYTAAIATDSRFEIPYYNRGLIRYRLGFFDDAKNDFEQALKLKPDFRDAKISLQQTIMDQHHKMTRGY